MNISIFFRIITSTFLPSIFVLVTFSCIDDRCNQADFYKEQNVEIEARRLESQLSEFENVENVLEFISKNRMLADYFLDANQYPNDTIIANRMLNLFLDPYIDTLVMESTNYFSDFDEIINELESAYRFIQFNYPEVKIPRVETFVSGLYNDMYVSDSLVIVGLDYFMGMNGSYHSNDIPLYIVKRYMRESLAPIVLSFVSNDFNKVDLQHKTLLSEMVNLGKTYYFVSEALPCKPDSLIIGYTSEEIKLAKENQEVIWANIIQNELLYETNHFVKNKFVGESPNVVEISEKCPGRIGAWVGWEIVRSYMEKNPEVTFKELMNESDAHKIFQLSGFKPRNEN
ncbi:MAG: gliding motility lipoprotein GldB [Reichenbachiella sp.]